MEFKIYEITNGWILNEFNEGHVYYFPTLKELLDYIKDNFQ